MTHWSVNFCVPASPKLSRPEQEKWDKEIYDAIRPLVDSCTTLGDCVIDLDSPNLPKLVRVLAGFHKQKVAWLNCPEFTERLTDLAQSRNEWFILHPKDEGEFDYGDPPSCKADRFKPGIHIAGFETYVGVSERFKTVVEDHKLTGADFIWLRDKGKYRAPQWYRLLAREPLGRGLDHPWFDSKKMTGQGYETKHPDSRHGQHNVVNLAGYALKADATFGDPVKDKLLALAKSMSGRRLVIITCPIFLRAFLPHTDFAFTVRDSQSGDIITRECGLAISRRTKYILISNHLVTEAECRGVVVLDEPYQGAEILDREERTPVPCISREKLDEWHARAEEARVEFLRSPKPVRAPSLARALTLLRARKRRQPSDFAPPAKAKDFQKACDSLGRPIPEAWQLVLRVCNGGKIEACELACGEACTITALAKLPDERRREADYYREFGAQLQDRFLPVMRTEIGDSIWLDTARPQPQGDCRVVLMSHETQDEDREWPSVAEFLDELLTD
jgi:hypothetical protein